MRDLERVREFKNKQTAGMYIAYGNFKGDRIYLFKTDVISGAEDLWVNKDVLEKDYELINEYYEEA